jgi:hypothetical protein
MRLAVAIATVVLISQGASAQDVRRMYRTSEEGERAAREGNPCIFNRSQALVAAGDPRVMRLRARFPKTLSGIEAMKRTHDFKSLLRENKRACGYR